MTDTDKLKAVAEYLLENAEQDEDNYYRRDKAELSELLNILCRATSYLLSKEASDLEVAALALDQIKTPEPENFPPSKEEFLALIRAGAE